MIRKIEEMSMNAYPSLHSVYYDGWNIRMSQGKTKRVNSVYSLYPSSYDIEEKVVFCEKIYKDKKQKSIFKMTDLDASRGLDSFLRDRSYAEEGRTSIQYKDLSNFSFESETKIEIIDEFSQVWFDDLCEAEGKSDLDKEVQSKAWKRVIMPQVYSSFKVDGKRVAFARAVIESGFVGVYGVFVHKEYRAKGYGELITNAILSFGKEKGCHSSYLQVELDNVQANGLYNKIGYNELYQYWYLVKEV